MDSSSRNGHSTGGGPPRSLAVPEATAYDAAIAVASAAEKERLQSIRLNLAIPPNSPEWGFYALLAPLMASGTMNEKGLQTFAERLEHVEQVCDDVKGRLTKAKIGDRDDIPGLRNPQMDRIESRQHEHGTFLRRIDERGSREPTIASLPVAVHVLLVVVMAACVGVGYFARILPAPASYVLLGAFALLAYLYLAPLVGPPLATALHRLSRIGK